VAIVQWNGEIGGAEVLSVVLASAFRRLGVNSEFVFVTSSGPLVDRLVRADIPFRVLGFKRGRDIMWHPLRYSAAVAACGPDGALLPECGFVGAALRAGGFDAPIAAIEHGVLLQRPDSAAQTVARLLNRIAGAWADDVEIGVSDYIVERMRRVPHARRFGRIYNGIDPAPFASVRSALGDRGEDLSVVGFAGRLIPGKGADDAIAAVAQALRRAPLRLLIAGDGPDRERLSGLARSLKIADRVEFLGMLADVRQLWQRCDVAIFPSNEFIESFGMVALEAMACGKPLVATRNGAAPELVRDRETGTVVSPGDVAALADALVTYAHRPALARSHGAAGRARVIQRFQIDQCAEAYLRCFGLIGSAGKPNGD
jgi:glycosyltransferase involved in cell wall biosynthesis